jgi:hypothetical protein
MDETRDSEVAVSVTMQDLRERYQRRLEELHRYAAEHGIEDVTIGGVVVQPPVVKIKDNKGDEHKEARAIELLYANSELWVCFSVLRLLTNCLTSDFDPKQEYPPFMVDAWRQDWTLNARGIYYRDDYSPCHVTMGRKIWVPTLEYADWDEPGQVDRRKRARLMAEHNISNETWIKSEYAWEADAWADVFGEMRNDPVLAM